MHFRYQLAKVFSFLFSQSVCVMLLLRSAMRKVGLDVIVPSISEPLPVHFLEVCSRSLISRSGHSGS